MDRRVAVITGANRGTGLAIARAFADRDYRTIGLNRTFLEQPWMEELSCDLRCKEQIANAAETIVTTYGGVDILVLNAAVRHIGPIQQLTDDQLEESIAVNFSSAFYLIRHLAPQLEQKNGMVLFIGSHAGMYPVNEGAAYCTTKAAMHALAQVSKHELRHRGVRSCLIVCGAIANRPMPGNEYKLQPDDVAEAIVQLTELPRDVLPALLELAPTRPVRSPVTGMDYLQTL